MSDWGDDVERRHFDGNFLNAVSTAPATTTARIGEELGSTLTRKVGEHTPTATELGSTLTRATELGSTLTRRVGEQVASTIARNVCEAETLDAVPMASQAKSVVQALSGDPRGAVQTQENFTRRCVGVSQIRSTLERHCQNEVAAAETQAEFNRGLRDVDEVARRAVATGFATGVAIAQEVGQKGAAVVEQATQRLRESELGGGAPGGIVLGAAAAAPSLAATSLSVGPEAYSCSQASQPDGAEPVARGSGQAEPSLLEEVQRLQAQLARERDLREMHTLTVGALDEAIRGLRADITERRRAMEQADEELLVAQDQLCRVEPCLETLQEQHSALLKRRAAQEVDLRRHAVAAFASEKEARELRREGGWARVGPETEALKDAKVALAEVLAELDEVQLQARRETSARQKEYEAAQIESEQLRHAAQQDTPRSLRRSVWRLLSRGGGGSEHRSA